MNHLQLGCMYIVHLLLAFRSQENIYGTCRNQLFEMGSLNFRMDILHVVMVLRRSRDKEADIQRFRRGCME